MSDILDQALDYAARGWAVFPCSPDVSRSHAKRPLVGQKCDREGNVIPRGGGLYQAATEPKTIEAWWQKWPHALIGVRMGRSARVFALDPDVSKQEGDADGLAAWNKLVAESGGLPPTHTHKTPSRGLHVLFRWNDAWPVSNREGDLPAGINVRGEGGYIIAPPSRLSNGRTYSIVDPDYFFCFGEAPVWLHRLIAGSPPATPALTGNSPVVERDVLVEPYVEAAVVNECGAVANALRGERNNRLNTAAFKLGTLLSSGVGNQAQVMDRLLMAGRDCGLLHEDGMEAVTATIRSGIAAGIARPRQLSRRTLVSASVNLPRRYREPNRETVDGVITQDSVARTFAETYAGKLRYCHHTGAWFEWADTYWRRDEVERALQFARSLGHDATEDRGSKELKEVRKLSFAQGVERFARGDTAFAVTTAAWDNDPYLLGTPGGTVDLRTGEIRSAEPAHGITRQTAVAPSEQATCPRWLAFLDETTGGDIGLIRLLAQWCGYSLTGVTSEHALVFVYGAGGNGKSVFLNTTSGIAGTYATTAPMDAFTASRGDRHPTDLAMLRGARMVSASETEEGRAWAESRIKQITGGDPISARFMRQDFFTYTPQFKLTIVGNHTPLLRNVDEAARRRFNLVPFTRRPANPDRRLEEKLRPEWPAILRWMIDGCRDWLENGLIRPEAVQAATEDYFDNQDLLGQWLAEECDCEPRNQFKRGSIGVLFESWQSYAQAAGEDPASKKAFSDNLKKRGFPVRRGTGGIREAYGVRKRPDPFWKRATGESDAVTDSDAPSV